jgi:hypothetical protein
VIIMSNRQYDLEVDTTWQLILYDTEEEKPVKETPPVNTEIKPGFAEEIAKREGYNTFEIIKTTTETRRYIVEG